MVHPQVGIRWDDGFLGGYNEVDVLKVGKFG